MFGSYFYPDFNLTRMANENALGSHFGYLAYHVEALSRREEELNDTLQQIDEKPISGTEQKLEERKALKEFKQDVTERIQQLEKQVANSLEDAPETTHEKAIEIRESAINTHLEEDEIPDTGFDTASEL
jgi:predicted ATP-binding protein involved in virulence